MVAYISKCKISYVDMQQKYVINICFNMGQFQWGRGHTYSKIIYASIFKSHVDIYMAHVDRDNSHVNCMSI